MLSAKSLQRLPLRDFRQVYDYFKRISLLNVLENEVNSKVLKRSKIIYKVAKIVIFKTISYHIVDPSNCLITYINRMKVLTINAMCGVFIITMIIIYHFLW